MASLGAVLVGTVLLLLAVVGAGTARVKAVSVQGDVVVYGATAAGCVAGIAAARSGAGRVVVATPYQHVGGMTTGGLMHADSANTSTIAGITLEFFERVLGHYSDKPEQRRPPSLSSRSPLARLVRETRTAAGSRPNLHPGSPGQVGKPWLYESHVAEQVLEAMLAEANVTVVRDLGGLTAASRNGTTLLSVTSLTGVQLLGRVWIDGSYEGDLAFVAGADMVWGRESQAQYNESAAGRRPPSLRYKVNPFWGANASTNATIPHVSGAPLVGVGEADDRIEAYDFRLCVTDSPSHRVPFPRPVGYNAPEWEFWRRLYGNGSSAPASLSAAGLGCLGPIPNAYGDCEGGPCVKCDMLGMQHATDMLNGAWAYPNATPAGRLAIRDAHKQYALGLLWFWATDPAAGEALHKEMAQIGMCSDEYDASSDPPHWPYQLYVREARRLVGDFVWTDWDPPAALAARSVGLGAYAFDCHWVSLYAASARDLEGAAGVGVDGADDSFFVAAEGRVNVGRDGTPNSKVYQTPYVVPYDALLPKRAQLANVLVPVACSCSHVRFNAVRMEPAWMIQGHAAGTAAALALAADRDARGARVGGAGAGGAGGVDVHAVDVPALQARLAQQNQKLWP